MMDWSLTAAPLLPLPLLAVAALIGLVLLWASWRAGRPGTLWRAAALAALLAAGLDPALERADRDRLPGIAALVIDMSLSQTLDDRAGQTEAMRKAMVAAAEKLPGIQLRTVVVGPDGSDGTRLFEAGRRALADVPPDRVAGMILLTDGQVHDVPAAADLGFRAPVHALISGHEGEIDRRIAIIRAPRFGLVGTDQTVTLRLTETGRSGGAPVTLAVRQDGEPTQTLTVVPGVDTDVRLRIAHAGPNFIELDAAALAGELTLANNRAAVQIQGIRENLRVLLVSGEPHPGERTWRNLLKSDASVDLVHFTILRPPEKQDSTPITELSLIAFPTRELFQEKIGDFDLIIFDRYQRSSILPSVYFDNIARYVRAGGAVLVAAGADLSGRGSMFRTPLSNVMPAEPTGRVIEQPFKPTVSDLGRRHPVTRNLPGAAGAEPSWSRWFRMVEVAGATGGAVMEGPDNQPLLLLAHEGEGRVGLLLSDQVWLWARGFEGGGPHAPLLRRLAHWLMKEPDLEEEALRLSLAGRDLAVERQTLDTSARMVTVTRPSGSIAEVTLTQAEPGLWRATVPADELGLWRASDGIRTALLNIGPINPREWSDVVSTTTILQPLASATGGVGRRMAQAGQLRPPRLAVVDRGGLMAGTDWIGLARSDVSVLKGVTRLSLYGAFVGLALLLGLLSLAWWREGR